VRRWLSLTRVGDQTRLTLGRRADLGADCANCFGLCCVALAFARSADFGYDKEAGEECVHLSPDDLCRIHPRLRDRGFKGCTVFDCFGAGQKVSRSTFDGVSWRSDPAVQAEMFAVFPIVRRLHELLFYLDVALELPGAEAGRERLSAAFARIEALTLLPPADLTALEVDAEADAVRPLLLAASADARRGLPRPAGKRLRPGAELLGADLRGQDLRGADLRGALLIAADLRGSDLRKADVLGADLRDARLDGADLSEAIFLTQMQVGSARGDSATRLPTAFARPSHWA